MSDLFRIAHIGWVRWRLAGCEELTAARGWWRRLNRLGGSRESN